jgi:glycosyltransferase involved in cell wall biosynthesis
MAPVDIGPTSSAAVKPLRLIIICWGYSIHAQRRINVFATDPQFQVTVISNYDYQIPRVTTVLLSLPRLLRRWEKLIEANTIWRKVARFLERSGLLMLPDYWIMKQAIDQRQPEVVLLQTLMYPCFLAIWLPKQIPQIVTFWNGDITWWAKWHGLEMIAKRWLVTRGARRAIAVTVNSVTAQQTCLNYGVNSEQIYLIGYPGIDRGVFFPRERSVARQQLKLAADQIVFWPRGIGGYLNSEAFLRAVALISTIYPQAQFIIITNLKDGGVELDHHQQLAEMLGVAQKIIWISHVDYAMMPLYYASANVVVSLSANDSRPNVMLEAMACGTPVVMTDLPQIREWITDNDNGYLVDPAAASQVADRIGRLLNPDHAVATQRIIERGLAIISERADDTAARRQIIQLVTQVAHSDKSASDKNNA